MAACALSTLCVGRHATARTRSLASQWSSSTSRPGGTLRPASTNIAQTIGIGGFSTTPSSSSSIDISTAALQRILAANQQGGNNGDNSSRTPFDLAAMSSLFALAVTGSVAMSTSPSYTSAEPSPRRAPAPMATSSKFASFPPSPFSNPLSEPNTSATATARPKVQIRRTVRRRYGDATGPFAVHDANNLPARFHFYQNAAECEGAPYQEEQKKDVLSDSKPYEVSLAVLKCALIHLARILIVLTLTILLTISFILSFPAYDCSSLMIRSLSRLSKGDERAWKMKLW